MEVKISIVMPVYNGGKFLGETLESLFKQSFKQFELICINDKSIDNSLQILHYYKDKLNMSIVNNEENIGLVPRIIKDIGLPNCKGNYYLYMSQDDLLSPDCLENMYLRMESEELDAVIPDLVYYRKDHSSEPQVGLNGDRDKLLSGLDAFKLSLDWTIPGCALIKTDLLRKVGFEEFNMFADEFTIRKYYVASNKIGFCNGTFYYRIDNPEAITKKVKPSLFQKLYKEVRLLELIYSNLEEQVFVQSVDRLVNMFYADYLTSYNLSFSKDQLELANSYLNNAYKRFVEFIDINKIKYQTNNLRSTIRYVLLIRFYVLFKIVIRLRSRM
ncbi:glycosyltransferase family 2 protein [Carboxylicivirga caseinilyticus]|uniref:glycosyltransferase family 2 protein n=1 Tax=Carboxylicivirga caseinilyticus TaxID=3417572 RepID=UPI003D3282F5|nr:glycosyltransferase family 2 protein [Marinilabiliaceae bacterium A049]